MDRYWEEKTRNSTAKGEKGLAAQQAGWDRLVRELRDLNGRLAILIAQRDKLASDHKDRFDQDHQAQEERRRLEDELAGANSNLSNLRTSVFAEIRKPHYLSSRFTAYHRASRPAYRPCGRISIS
ncbi:MAG: hypothetical protein JOY71_31105 [Acetobacteraceae bacterium]|nr:hypothetical protein [Acetobacteraceae bacterium]MBV8526512.1 hypothetical protein [Acetobacteraceae bacterium]